MSQRAVLGVDDYGYRPWRQTSDLPYTQVALIQDGLVGSITDRPQRIRKRSASKLFQLLVDKRRRGRHLTIADIRTDTERERSRHR